jgi:8-oxo-dGTP pyrophosphatase MutT (NUDIX family)
MDIEVMTKPVDPIGKQLSRQHLWRGSIGDFGVDEVELSGGRRATIAVLHHPGAAAVVPFVDRETILMLRQYRYAIGATIWEVPAGKIDPGESPMVCAARELQEETGHRAGRVEPVGVVSTVPAFSDERIYLFCAYELRPGPQQLAHDETIEVHQVPLRKAIDMIASGAIVDAKTIVALFHAGRRAGLFRMEFSESAIDR